MLKVLIMALTMVMCMGSNGVEFTSPDSAIEVEYSRFENMPSADEGCGVVEADCVPDAESAVEIARVVLSNVWRGESLKDVFVTCDDAAGIWVVCFHNEEVIGGCFSIAIKRSDGQVVKMWAGE